MKLHELFEDELNEAQAAEFDAAVEKYVELLFEEGEGGGDPSAGGDPSPTQAPTEPTGPGGPGGGGTAGPTAPPHNHNGWGTGNQFGAAWFATFASQLMWLSSATRINKRLRQIGLKGEGARRMSNAAVQANKNINLLLNNPGWRQQNWTIGGPSSSSSAVASMKKLVGTQMKKSVKKRKTRK